MPWKLNLGREVQLCLARKIDSHMHIENAVYAFTFQHLSVQCKVFALSNWFCRTKEKEEMLNSKRNMHRSLKFFNRRPFGRSDSYSEDEEGRANNKSVHFKVKIRRTDEMWHKSLKTGLFFALVSFAAVSGDVIQSPPPPAPQERIVFRHFFVGGGAGEIIISVKLSVVNRWWLQCVHQIKLLWCLATSQVHPKLQGPQLTTNQFSYIIKFNFLETDWKFSLRSCTQWLDCVISVRHQVMT